jgi:hypothetical protein
MNVTTTPKKVSRRRFVGFTVVVGAAAVAGASLFQSRRQGACAVGFAPDTPLVRNPAFTAQRSNGLILSTTTSKGERIAFRMDAEAKMLWDNIPKLTNQSGPIGTTVGQLVDFALAKYRERDASIVRREVRAFLQAGLQAGIIMKPGTHAVEIQGGTRGS